MPRPTTGLLPCLILVMLFAPAGLVRPAAADEPDRAPTPHGIEFFEKHIRPVLAQKCYECHSAKSDSVMNGLRLDTSAGLLKGGDNGPAVLPGDAKNSLLIKALRQDESVGFEMPPDGKLPDATINHFVEWIRIGAPMPESTPAETKDNKPSEWMGAAGDFWAFRPPQKTDPPEVKNRDWPRDDIDRFVLARLEREGLTPAGDADPRTLIRRAYFDLWGVPPSPEEVREFVRDPSPLAYEKLLDRLLDSPLFGQRWGRHWLDVARYAESTGHERNFLYPHAWRYRDYVIDAFNTDKPYDRFLLEQLAGDKLPAENPEQRDEQLTATGFLALGPRNLLARDDEFRLAGADDQINVTTRAILGLTVSCARCHDHKFDPISTKEYYALAGIFLSTETLYGTVPGTGGGNNRHPAELVPLGPDAQKRHQAVLEHTEKIAAATKEYAKAQNRLKKLRSLPEKQLANKQDELKAAEKEHDTLKAQLDELKRNAPQPPQYAMGVRDAEKIVDTKVRIRGNERNEGERAPRGLLACCTTGEAPEIPADASGRLELAKWLVSEENPLTSRVIVNRIWHHLLGRGLVPTVDNFGKNGQPPSHPQLLDRLAVDFRENDGGAGWSTKRMIRRIMLSRTYRQSSAWDAENDAADPDNSLLWRNGPRRLDAEAIRDAILAAAGRLDYAPPQEGSVVARLGDGCLVRQVDPEGLQVEMNRRSVYLPAARFFEPEILQVFDGASASLVVGNRPTTNVPAQALFLLNNDFVIEHAQHAADRLLDRRDLDEYGRVERAYRLVLARPPTEAELKQTLDYLHRGLESPPRGAGWGDRNKQQRRLWAALLQALFTTAEFRYLY